jgi:hypothetical protein
MFESLSKNQRDSLRFSSVKGEFVQLRTKFKNPYFSPRVINALIEDIIEQAQILLLEHGYSPPSPSFIQMLQTAVDDVGYQVHIKGISLTKLISIEVTADTTVEGNVNFHLKPLCEDGKYLLKAIEQHRTPDPVLPPLPTPQFVQPTKGKITRIVEI